MPAVTLCCLSTLPHSLFCLGITNEGLVRLCFILTHKSTLAGFKSLFAVKTCNWFLFAWQEVLQELCSRIWVGDEAGSAQVAPHLQLQPHQRCSCSNSSGWSGLGITTGKIKGGLCPLGLQYEGIKQKTLHSSLAWSLETFVRSKLQKCRLSGEIKH